MSPRFTATYRQHAQGWHVAVAEVETVLGFGRTLESARLDTVAQLAEHFRVQPSLIDLCDAVELVEPGQEALASAIEARAAALEASAVSQQALSRAVDELHRQGLSLRDTGYLLGLSHARVRQLLQPAKDGRQKKPSRGRLRQ